MNRRLFQFAIVLLWLALPLIALEYRQAWDRLPVNMATHFNAANTPNGWMPREASLNFSLRLMVIVLTVSSAVLVAATWREISAFSWALLGFFALMLGFFVAVNQAILNYNLHETPVHPERMLVAIGVAALALFAFYLISSRQAPLPESETLAVETHAGRLWSTLILVAVIGPLLAIALAPSGVRWPVFLAGVIGVGAFAMAWSGFQYRFMQHGLEIRMLGFRLRSIPRSAILSYSIEPWSFIRGYGIRGIGSTRAYVWCNRVVHIKTSNGEVYLGHRHPERIVGDLDRMMGLVTKV
jgi:Protein of unknown function (DUF1648)